MTCVRFTHPDTAKPVEQWMHDDVFDLWYERAPESVRRSCEAVVIDDDEVD